MGGHVYLVRHAEAESAHERCDAERALTAAGRERFRAFVAALAPRLAVSRILASPLLRARQTAELLAAATDAAIDEEELLFSGASSGSRLLTLARRSGAGIALVGHNPEIAEAIGLVAAGEEHVAPGTIAAVELGPPPSLAWIAAP